LLDFGVAKVLRGATVAPPGLVVSQSFTPSYGAPEQFSTAYGTTGPWTDVFAFALIVVELLTGHEALQGEEVGALAIQSCDPHVRPTPRALGAVVSDEVEAVLAHGLAVNPEDRFESVRDLWDALVAALVSQEEPDIEVSWDDSGMAVDGLESGETSASGETSERFSETPVPSEPPSSSEPAPSATSSSEPSPSAPGDFQDLTLPLVLNRLRRGAAPSRMEKAT
jgi:serine/threonine protein kinase